MSSSLLYWLLLIVYVSSLWASMIFLGINWYKMEIRYKRPPQRILVITYVINFFIMFYVFSIPILI